MIVIGGVGFDGRDDRGRIGKPGHVVEVPVGVVSRDAVAQPEDVRHAVVVPQVPLDLLLRQLGVPVRIEEAALARQQRPGAVHLDRAPLHHDARMEHLDPELRAHLRGDHVIEVEGRVLPAPGIVAPVDDRLFDLAGDGALHEAGAVIAAPGVVGREGMEEDVRGGDARGLERGARRGLDLRRGVDVHLFAGRQGAHYLREDRRDRRELPRPRLFLVRPAEPGPAVGGPLRWHRESQLTWGDGHE